MKSKLPNMSNEELLGQGLTIAGWMRGEVLPGTPPTPFMADVVYELCSRFDSIQEASPMTVVYIAGPYRAKTQWLVLQNIHRAEALAVEAWQWGFVVICPHKNMSLLSGSLEHPDEDNVWLKGGLELVKRSDVVLTTDDWEQSEGACGEVEYARQLGKPVYHSLEDLCEAEYTPSEE